MEIKWCWKTFAELSNDELYDSCALRESVFTHEQKCTETDLDGLDKQAIHLLGFYEDTLIVYVRVLPKGVYKPGIVSFGRLAVTKEFRGQKLGREAMQKAIEYIKENFPGEKISFSAQLYLQKFYEDLGFKAIGTPYDEGGIEHIEMVNQQ